MKNKSVIVFNLFYAKTLVKQGFKITNIDFNHKDPTKLVFYFENTPEFKQALKALTNK